MEIEEHIPLAPFTTFHLGGPARYFARAATLKDLKKSLDFAKEKQLKILVLGGASNILAPDEGFGGLVIKIEFTGIELEEQNNKTLLIAGAGESWDGFVERAVTEELWGIENLSGIPGTVGGAVAGSIGAYGQAVSQTLEWVEVLDMASREVKKLSNQECNFGYRESIFTKTEIPLIILRAAFNLSEEAKSDLSYRDLKARFGDLSLDLVAIRKAILEIRAGKFPDMSVEGTAGSFFKNPILSPQQAQHLKEQYPEIPLFDMPETSGVKVPLAWLLDHILQLKGTKIGGARLFEKQPLVIAAEKNCSARDVVALADLVKQKVKEKFDFEIEEEVKIISN